MTSKILHRNFFILLISDTLIAAGCIYLAFLLRHNFDLPPETEGMLVRFIPAATLLKIVILYFYNAYQGMWRYFSINDFLNIVKAASLSSLILIAVVLFAHRFTSVSRAVFIIDWVLTVVFISSLRLSIRLILSLAGSYSRDPHMQNGFSFFHRNGNNDKKNLVIIGAGNLGERIFREINDSFHYRYNVVGFLDDDESKIGRQIHGKPVLGKTSDLHSFAEKLDIHEILIAIPSATGPQMRSIVEDAKRTGISTKTLPSMGELIDGKVTVKALRDVAYRDLLGREVIRLDEEKIGEYLEGESVLVTGAGGSIGSELCRQICRFNPAKIVLFERAESPLYEIEIELKRNFPHIKVEALLADIRDRRQLLLAFQNHFPIVVFHAAAYKHVPMMELQPWKAVRNNIVGTRNVVEISKIYSVVRFVFVSTDKAVRPTNIMGATKRAAEIFVQSQNGDGATATRFMIVRFGNVVGSVGSVVPLFKKQIEKGGPLTVTHPEMTRYFMMIPEACQLILQTGAMGRGGEIFILDMGTPIKIDDMAKDLIRLSGLELGRDIEIEYIGLRPGEKLHEELITEGEGIIPTSHEKIMVLKGANCDTQMLNTSFDELREYAYNQDAEAIRKKLQEMIPEYEPSPFNKN